MKSTDRYKENTMKNFNRYAAFSLRAVLAAAVMMFGIIRSNDYVSVAEPTAFAAEQTGPGALQWRQTSGPEGASIISLLSRYCARRRWVESFCGAISGPINLQRRLPLDRPGRELDAGRRRLAPDLSCFFISRRRAESICGI